jgi:L-rhamnose isomerase
VPGGYAERAVTLREVLRIAGSIDGIDGVEIIHSQLEGMDRGDFKGWLDEVGLKLTGILVNTFGDRKYKLGSISHADRKIRQDAIDLCKKSVDMAVELDCPVVVLWLGSDGYDCSFQVDYRDQRNTMRESITEIARYNRDTKICLEYKLKDPRKYMTIGAVGKALYLAQACGRPWFRSMQETHRWWFGTPCSTTRAQIRGGSAHHG